MQKTKYIKKAISQNCKQRKKTIQVKELTEKEKGVKIRNKDNAQLTRLKERIIVPFLKSKPYLYQKYRKSTPYDINRQALAIGFSQLIQFQSDLKGDLFSTKEDLKNDVRSKMIQFSANLLSYTEEDLFQKNKSDLMEHNAIPNNQKLVREATQLLDMTESNITQILKNQDFDIKNGEVQFNTQKQVKELYKRSKNNRHNFKSAVLFLVMLCCTFDMLTCQNQKITNTDGRCLFVADCSNNNCYLKKMWSYVSQINFSHLYNSKGGSIQTHNKLRSNQKQMSSSQVPQVLQNITNQTEPAKDLINPPSESYLAIIQILCLILSSIGICLLSMYRSYQNIQTTTAPYSEV